MRGETTPHQDPLYDLRDWGYSPSNDMDIESVLANSTR